MTFEEVKNRYLLKIGEAEGNQTEIDAEICERLKEAYWTICSNTDCTWKKPSILTLAEVTATTNEHRLTTALSLSDGEVLEIYRCFWDGKPLNRWSKGRIDQRNAYNTSHSGSDPTAFAFFEEYNSSDGDKRTYIAFFPYVNAANTTDCQLSYFRRPPQPTAVLGGTYSWDVLYPEFGSEYHHIIADLAALSYLEDVGDARYTSIKHRLVWDKIYNMRDHYVNQLHLGDLMGSLVSAGFGGKNNWLEYREI